MVQYDLDGEDHRRASLKTETLRYYLLTEAILFAGVLIMQMADQREAEDVLVFLCIACNAVYILRTSSGLPLAAMLLTLCADTFMVLLNVHIPAGIWLFCCVQLLYAWCLHKRGYRLLPVRILAFVLPAAVVIITGPKETADLSVSIPAILSFSLLVINVVCAVAAGARFNTGADRLFAAGLLMFLGCDLCVGLRNLPVPQPVQTAAYALNWIFYIPSQVLLTVSLPEIWKKIKNKRALSLTALLLLAVIMIPLCAVAAPEDTAEDAVCFEEVIYLGVLNYGSEETGAERKNDFRYRFESDEGEQVFAMDNGVQDETGRYDYPLQNRLKEGYPFRIGIREGKVISVDELPVQLPSYTPPAAGTPGLRTIRNFLLTALEPAGTVLYVYGGGWNWQDTGASVQARTVGVSSDWVRFFREQDADYTYRDPYGNPALADPPNSYYPYGGFNEYYYAGLDCSGYLGWAVYNTLETQDGKDGYVTEASRFAKAMSDLGLGSWSSQNPVSGLKPGDIISTDRHVWISLGKCDDGSILCLHSTAGNSRRGQPGGGVQLSALGFDRSCEAYRLADSYMSEYCPEWYGRYEVLLKDPDAYLYHQKDTAGIFSWDLQEADGMSDPDGIRDMDPETILHELISPAANAH